MQDKPPTDIKELEKGVAKNNARIRKAVKIGIKMLDGGGLAAASNSELRDALQEIADNICTKPPGCDPTPTD